MSKGNLNGFDPFASANKTDQRQRYAATPTGTAPSQRTTAPPPQPNAPQIQYLQQQGFSSGLIQALLNSRNAFPLRIWILDNSAAMNVADSHRISGTFDNLQNLPVTRWQELQDCVAYHAQMASLFHFPTRYALLNDPGSNIGPQYFSLAEHGPANVAQELEVVKRVMTSTRPAGPAMLTEEIAGLQRYICSIAPRLRQQNQTVSIIITTQGIPTSPNFVATLRSLEGLPVWVVVRLCTDEESVFDFYNSLDAQLNLPYDVLDDFFGEALEVYLRNPWLNYGLPLHRFREFGVRVEVLDVMDERALNVMEVRDLCSLLFATSNLPDPTVNWNGFLQAVSSCMAREKQQWNPVTHKLSPWLNLHDLNHLYGPRQQAPQQFPVFHQPQGSYAQPQHVYAQQRSAPPPMYAQQQHHQQQPTYPNQSSRPPHVSPQQARQPPRQQGQTAPPPVQQSQSTAPAAPAATDTSVASLKTNIMRQWALQPPTYNAPRPIHRLIGTVHTVFPPALGVEPHDYFGKWKPMSLDALSSGQEAVVKRAIRKMKFFLHPDKLPRDFSEKQSLLCKTLWDVTADAEEQATAGK